MSKVIPITLAGKAAPKEVRSDMKTRILTPEDMQQWVIPPFQRPIKINKKVREVADEMKQSGDGTGYISGIISIGLLPDDDSQYLCDGQHRREAAYMSELKEFLAEVCYKHFNTMAEMAAHFVRLNSQIRKMTPDDILRGLEGSLRPLQIIKKECPFIGYGYVRSNSTTAPIIGMAAAIRAWRSSSFDTPGGSAGKPAEDVAAEMSVESAVGLVKFMQVAFSAWGRDVENYRLWSALNLILCMWMWRTLVLDQERLGSKRYNVLTVDQFKKCLFALASHHDYKDWVVNRNASDHNRGPCYSKIRSIFTQRLSDEGVKQVKLPNPLWAKAR